MSNKKEAATEQEFDLGFKPEDWSQIKADQGIGVKRLAIGDYRFKIAKVAAEPTKNAKEPHVMLRATFQVVKALDGGSEEAVGQSIESLYAGSPQSPAFMQKRLKALCEAIKVSPGANGLRSSQLLGKEFDGTVVWELSDANKLNEMGEKMYYVNDRVKAERAVNTARPAQLNPQVDSRQALAHLEKLKQRAESDAGGTGGGAETAATGEGGAAPWDTTASGTTETKPSFMDESQVDGTAHTYRAAIKLEMEGHAEYRAQLVDAGIDPDGPVKIDMIEDDEIKAAYTKKFTSAANGAPKKLGKLKGGAASAST